MTALTQRLEAAHIGWIETQIIAAVSLWPWFMEYAKHLPHERFRSTEAQVLWDHLLFCQENDAEPDMVRFLELVEVAGRDCDLSITAESMHQYIMQCLICFEFLDETEARFACILANLVREFRIRTQ